METQESYPGFAPAAYGTPAPYAPAPVSPPVQTPHFRPLSTGEVLDRTFTLYRQRFWLFAGIGVMPAAVMLICSALRLILLAATHKLYLLQVAQGPQASANAMASLLELWAYAVPATALFFVAYAISHAATVHAVRAATDGATATVEGSYRAVMRRWLRWCGIVFRQFWSLMWPVLPGSAVLGGAIGFLAFERSRGNVGAVAAGLVAVVAWLALVAGIVFGVINMMRTMLAMAAGVQEDIVVSAAMRRSRQLVAGRKGRIFVTLVLVGAMQMVVGAVEGPLAFVALSMRGGAFIALQAVLMLVQFAAVTLVVPVASIAFTLFYFDERTRREGFDIELMMRQTLPAQAPLQGM